MTELTLLYDIKQILVANTWFTGGGFAVALVAIIISILALWKATR